MKKRVLAFLCMLAVTGTSINFSSIPADTVQAAETGRTFYISSKNGNNANDGTSQAQAWETLDKLIDLELKPGDKVLLEKGSVFNDAYIHLVDVHGEKGNPIVISSYGEGAKPAIHANGQGVWYQQYGRNLDNANHKRQGYVSSTILLYDVDFVEISDLEITNESNDFDYFKGAIPELDIPENSTQSAGSGNKRMDRTGVAGAAKNGGTMQHVYLDNLYIHNVDGNIGDKHMDNGGIQMNVLQPEDEEATGIARYDDIRITNCYVRDVSRAGICVGYTYQHAKFNGAAISDETAKVYGHTNLLMENNYVKDVGNDGIVAMYSYRPLVQNNIADRAGADMDAANGGYGNYYGYVCAGIWPWKCKSGIFQYNEAFDIVNNQDGMPWDIDSSDGTVYQYNYSHNNGGGCVMFCGGEAYNGVFRYNISQNDLKGLLILSGNPRGEVYNNVFYIDGDRSTKIHNPSFCNGTGVMKNNIFYNISNAKSAEGHMDKTNDTWSNNIFYGYDGLFTIPEGNLTDDPKFEDPGQAPTDVLVQSEGEKASLHDRTIVYNGYKLKADSPAINAGTFVEGAPKYDFFGNQIGLQPDIGVFESDAAETELDIKIVGGSSLELGEGVISGIASRMTVEELSENLIYAQDIDFKVLNNNQELSKEDIVATGMIVQISRGNESKEYQIETSFGIQAANSSIRVGENVISGVKKTMTVKELIECLICAQDVDLKVLKDNQEMNMEDVVTADMKVRISKGSESKEYQIDIEKEYIEYDPDTMTATAGSVEPLSGSNTTEGGGDLALDKNTDTKWHTNWNGCSRDDVWIEFDLKSVKPVSMVKYVSRKAGVNGIFRAYQVLVKENEDDEWQKVSEGTWPDSTTGTTEYANFNTVNARYVRLVGTETLSQTSSIFGSAAEIRIGYAVED